MNFAIRILGQAHSARCPSSIRQYHILLTRRLHVAPAPIDDTLRGHLHSRWSCLRRRSRRWRLRVQSWSYLRARATGLLTGGFALPNPKRPLQQTRPNPRLHRNGSVATTSDILCFIFVTQECDVDSSPSQQTTLRLHVPI